MNPARSALHLRITASILIGCIAAALALPSSAAIARIPNGPTATTIVVTRSDDPESDSITRTCAYSTTLYNPAEDGCTLRRALVEAGARPAEDRPITVAFNLSESDPGYDGATETWTLTIDGPLKLKPESITAKTGQVTIDGRTQPEGRTATPRVFVDTNDHSLEVEMEDNVIRALGFFGGGVIFLKENGNLVEDITMGLSPDGQSIVLRDPANPQRMAGGGVHISADDNTVRNNVISGAFARAIEIDGGDDNLIEGNDIGTRTDGTIPEVNPAIRCLRSMNYDPKNWYGGWGIQLSGTNNTVMDNLLAGLHILQSTNDTPPRAIEIFGAEHLIEGNVIGMDADGTLIGVCGQAIKVSGSGTLILDNFILASKLDSEDAEPAAILASDTSPQFGEITVVGNWVAFGPGKIYGFGPGIPESLRLFEPAVVTEITETTVGGTSAPGSPCAGCRIDIYQDNDDGNQEARKVLGGTTADQDGNWTIELEEPLPDDAYVRTGSTALESGVIGNFGPGTSSKISSLYPAPLMVVIDGPAAGETNTEYRFDITTSTRTTQKIYDYTVTATGVSEPLTGRGGSIANVGFTWGAPGVKVVEVTASNAAGSITASHTITLTGPAEISAIYLPYITR